MAPFRPRMYRFLKPWRFVIQHHVLLPALALALLAGTWWFTLSSVRAEEARASQEAVQLTQRLLETYEAQTLRVVNEINQSFKLIDYAYSVAGVEGTLSQLRSKNLLLPDMLFITRVLDSQGRVVAASREGLPMSQPASRMLQAHRQSDGVHVDGPYRLPGEAEPVIDISRRLGEPGTPLTHVVVVTMPVSYLVSDYDEGRFGKKGVMGVLGTQGVFVAMRTGGKVVAGTQVPFSRVVRGEDEAGAQAALVASPWDGVPRYVAARRLYNVPLAVVVALDQGERLAAVRATASRNLYKAAAASCVIVLISGALTWLSWRVAVLRRREAAARLAHARQVEHLAFHDGLTGLPNRRAFHMRLHEHLAAASPSGRISALLFLDLDGFKRVNDLQGHQAGDELLKQVSARLLQCVRESDAVARLGGDEFVVLLAGVDDRAYVTRVAERVIASIGRPYNLLGQEGRVTVSVGICMYPRDGMDEETLLKHADDAMYHAKEEGKNRYAFHQSRTAVVSA